MLSLSQLRKADPSLDYLTDEELEQIAKNLYALGNLTFDCWLKENVSKFPEGLLPKLNVNK